MVRPMPILRGASPRRPLSHSPSRCSIGKDVPSLRCHGVPWYSPRNNAYLPSAPILLRSVRPGDKFPTLRNIVLDDGAGESLVFVVQYVSSYSSWAYVSRGRRFAHGVDFSHTLVEAKVVLGLYWFVSYSKRTRGSAVGVYCGGTACEVD